MSFAYRCLLVLALLVLVLSSCSSQTPTTAPTEPVATATRRIIPTLAPSATVTPTPTETPLPSATPTVTQTPLPTTDPVLSQARLLGVSWQSHYNLMLTIQFLEDVDAADYRVVVEEEEYECQQLAQFPKRLYCIGRGGSIYRRAEVQIYAKGSEQPGYEGEISIPWFTSQQP